MTEGRKVCIISSASFLSLPLRDGAFFRGLWIVHQQNNNKKQKKTDFHNLPYGSMQEGWKVGKKLEPNLLINLAMR